jgi:transposase
MRKIVLSLPKHVKVRLRCLRRSTRDSGLATRCQIILHAGKGRSSRTIAEAVGCSRSWVSRVIGRFIEHGEAGLVDRREDNGRLKLDEWYLGQLHEVVAKRPTDYGYRRPTWTRELLVAVMKRLTGTRIHAATMSRALKCIGARRGRPRPVVRCPWSKRAKNRRLGMIRRALDELADDEVFVYQDEVDIHLNPKIGLDWMNRGQQKEVLTPGQNEKRYLAGAMNPGAGQLTVVEGVRKNSALFIEMLKALAEDYPEARRIHVVLDNYRIHSSQMTRLALAGYGGRIVLHFLPPYCPQENKIERLWLDLHSEVTRNHSCATMNELMRNVRHFLRKRPSTPLSKIRRPAA